MKPILTTLVLALRWLSRWSPIARAVHGFLGVLPVSDERRDTLRGYVLSPLVVRALADGLPPHAYTHPARRTWRGRAVSAASTVAIHVMRGANRLGWSGFPRWVFRQLYRMGFDEERIESFRLRLYDEPDPSRRQLDTHIFVLDHDEARQSGPWRSRLATERDLVRQFPPWVSPVIHVFVDSGADLPDVLATPEFDRVKWVVHVGGGAASGLDTSVLGDGVRLEPIGDKFDEVSEEGSRLYAFGRDLGRTLAKRFAGMALDGIIDVSSRLEETLGSMFDGYVNPRLSRALAWGYAFRGIPPEDGVIICTSTRGGISEDWSVVEAKLRDRPSAVIFSNTSQDYAVATVRGMMRQHEQVERRPTERTTPPQSVMSALRYQHVGLSAGARNVVMRLASTLPRNRASLLLHGLHNAAYAKSFAKLKVAMEMAHDAGRLEPPVYMLTMPYSPEMEEPKGHRRGRFVDVFADTALLDRHTLDSREAKLLVDWLLAVPETSDFEGWPVRSQVAGGVLKAIRAAWPRVVMGYEIGRGVAATVDLQGTVSTTTRPFAGRAVAAGLLDGSTVETPVIDVQTLNILRHPKYRLPMATHAAVIDTNARSDYIDYLGFDPDRIILAGSPGGNDTSRQDMRPPEDARRDLGIPEDRKVVTLISQLQPMEAMASICAPLAEVCARRDATLLVRLHPREGQGRRAAYERQLSSNGRDLHVVFSKTEPPETVVAATDIAVTIYSNMARDMARVGRPVVAARYAIETPPIDIADAGLALAADSADELRTQVEKVLKSEDASHLDWSAPYFQANAHLLEEDSADRVVDALSSLGQGEVTQMPPSETSTSNDGDAKPVLLAMPGVRIPDIPVLFEPQVAIDIYAESNLGIGFQPLDSHVFDARHATVVAPSLSDIVARGEASARHAIDSVLSTLEPSAILGARSETVANVLWLHLRPSLINTYLRQAHVEAVLRAAGDRPLTICARNIADLAYVANRLSGVSVAKRFVLLEEGGSHRQFGADELVLKGIAIQDDAALTGDLLARALSDLDDWHGGLDRSSDADADPQSLPRSVLVTTDWKLKTVAPTLLPVLERLQDGVEWMHVVNMTDKSLGVARDQLRESMPPTWHKVGSPASMDDSARPYPARALKRIARVVMADLGSKPEWTDACPGLVPDLLRGVEASVRTGLPDILTFEAYCERVMSSERTVSVACPGRQWHAVLAHEVAKRSGVPSVTIQNAYMSAGHTYVAPTGDYITAIDSWTKRLLVDHYGLPESDVHIVSTPRFDSLKDTRSLDRDALRRRHGFGEAFVILFAAQVGFDDEAERIVRALARVADTSQDASGRPIRAIAKLHPRSPEDVVSRMRAAADSANAGHAVEIVKDEAIEELLVASDAVVTLFSNVGVEAVILRRPLLVVKFGEDSYDMPMDKYGFAPVAETQDEIVDCLSRMARDESFRNAQLDMAETFLAENPVMVAGNSAETIANVVEGFLDGPAKSSRNTARHDRGSLSVQSS